MAIVVGQMRSETQEAAVRMSDSGKRVAAGGSGDETIFLARGLRIFDADFHAVIVAFLCYLLLIISTISRTVRTEDPTPHFAAICEWHPPRELHASPKEDSRATQANRDSQCSSG